MSQAKKVHEMIKAYAALTKFVMYECPEHNVFGELYGPFPNTTEAEIWIEDVKQSKDMSGQFHIVTALDPYTYKPFNLND